MHLIASHFKDREKGVGKGNDKLVTLHILLEIRCRQTSAHFILLCGNETTKKRKTTTPKQEIK